MIHRPTSPGTSFLLVLAALAATPLPASAQSHGIAPLGRQNNVPDLDPGVESRRVSKARMELSLGGVYVFDLGSDAKNQEGWGGALNLTFLPDRDPDYPNWQLKFGAELLYFGTSGEQWIGPTLYHESIDAGVVYANFGGSYYIGEYFEIGALAGVGTGGSYGETKNGAIKDSNGNWNWAVQLKPHVAVHFTDNVSLYAAYRISYIGPMYRADLIGYESVDMIHQSAEIGLTWRF